MHTGTIAAEYAKRHAARMPMLQNRADLSITQSIFRNVRGQRTPSDSARHLHFRELADSNWGVSWQQLASTNTNNQTQILTIRVWIAKAGRHIDWPRSTTIGDAIAFHAGIQRATCIMDAELRIRSISRQSNRAL